MCNCLRYLNRHNCRHIHKKTNKSSGRKMTVDITNLKREETVACFMDQSSDKHSLGTSWWAIQQHAFQRVLLGVRRMETDDGLKV